MTSGGHTSRHQKGSGQKTVLSEHSSHRWGNAHVFIEKDDQGRDWVVKDFSVCSLLVRWTSSWFLLWREYRALNRLQEIEGTPGPPVIRGRWLLKYPFIPAKTLKKVAVDNTKLDSIFFERLEALVHKMHTAGVVHLDMRNKRNILITPDNHPVIIDFQTAIFTKLMPRRLRRLLESVDLSGVYKYWERFAPEGMTPERIEIATRMKSLRPLWVIEGYPLRNFFRKLLGKKDTPQRPA
jgi:RIO-like serine/threonine protein kinase